MRVELDGVRKEFPVGAGVVVALDGVSLAVDSGAFVAFMGRSGSGKSTLLHLVAGIEAPTAGRVVLDGRPLGDLGDDEMTRLRRDRIGIVYQFFHLLPTLTALENVALPALLAGLPRRDAEARARRLLAEVGLGTRERDYSDRFSGGEQQRVAIARALVNDPALLLADEPTGNLDTATGEAILDLLAALARRRGATILLATHDAAAAGRADRIVRLRDGRIDPSGA